MDHLQIPMEDGSWKQRYKERMEKLKTSQFPSQDAASQSGLLHKELLGEKQVLIPELYKSVESGNVDNFVQVLEQVCSKRKLLLSAIFDQVTRAGDSLLHVAAHLGKEQIAELICDDFPELLTRRNIRGDSVLHVAVRSKNSNMVKVILSQLSKHDGVKVEEVTRLTNEYGDTALHEAVYSGHPEIVQDVLHEYKSVVHNLNKLKRSPLYLTAATGSVDILNLLLQTPFPSDQPLPQCHGNSPLHAAIKERNPAIIKEILAKRPELVYLRDKDGNTPLHYAAYIGYIEGFRILLENSLEKLDQTAMERNKKGHLPIHLACKRGHLKVVKEFFQHEWPNLNILNNQKGQNILHVAAKNAKSSVVRYLMRDGKIDQFTINQKDINGNTPLHLASISLFPKVMYFITEDKKTSVNLTNNEGLTARDIVRLVIRTQLIFRKFVANRALRAAKVPMKVDGMIHSQHPIPISVKSEDVIHSILVAATLMVTVTFAAAFTVPGGVYSSDDPNPKNRGMAVFAHKPLFWVFTTFNMIAMYSSVIACALMLMAQIFRPMAVIAIVYAMWILALAFLAVPVAFMAAVRLVVPNNSLLALVTVIEAMYSIFIFLLVLVILGIECLPAKFTTWPLVLLLDYRKKLKDSSSKRVKKDNKDNVKEKDKDE